MDLELALQHLNRSRVCDPHSPLRLCVTVFNPGSIGGTPCIDIKSINAGFDWDKGKILLEPTQPVTLLTPEDVNAIHASAKNAQSWHAYQSYQKQAKRIQELEAEVRMLREKSSKHKGE